MDALLNSCNIHFAQDQHAAAEQCYLQVLQWDDTYVRGMVNLAAFYQATLPSQIPSQNPSQNPSQMLSQSYRAQAKRALALYQRALVIDPSNHMARHGQAIHNPNPNPNALSYPTNTFYHTLLTRPLMPY